MPIPLGFLASAGGALASWITRTYSSSQAYDYAYQLIPQADGTSVGFHNTSDQSYYTITKFSATGTVLSSIKNNNGFPNGVTNTVEAGVKMDNSGNFYGFGWSYQNGGFYYPAITKWNSNFGITLSKFWTNGVNNHKLNDGDVNSSGNMAAHHRTDTGQSTIAFLDSTFTQQWVRRPVSMQTYPTGIKIANSNAVYVSYVDWSSAKPTFVKYSSAGAVIWFKRLSFTSQNVNSSRGCLDLDNSENIYMVANNNNGYPQVSKWASDGTKLWETSISSNCYYSTLTVDKVTGEVYVMSSLTAAGRNAVITKLDASGNIIWNREISSVHNELRFSGALNVLNGLLYIALPVQNPNNNNERAYWWVVPTDGSKTGTYTVGDVSYTYAVGNYSVAANTGTWDNVASTDSNWGAQTMFDTGATQAAFTVSSSTTQI